MAVPRDIGKAGRAFLRDVGAWLTAERWELEPHELVVLHNAARQVDRAATIREALADEELSPTDPAYARLLREERAAGVELRRTLFVLGLPLGPQAEKKTPAKMGRPGAGARTGEPMSRTESARIAAAARWNRDASA